MAGSVNKVILVGNLGNDPTVRTTQDGKEIANFSVATSESWRDRNTGERREKTEWHRIVIFNDNLVNITKNYLKKGAKIYLEGALQTRKWVDNSGQEKYSTEIILQGYNAVLTMLDRPQHSGENYNNNHAATSQEQPRAAAAAATTATTLDDEIPF